MFSKAKMILPIILIAMAPLSSCSNSPEYSWKVNENISAHFEDNGNYGFILCIEGEGDMPDYESGKDAPWYYRQGRVVELRISEGITRIGDYAFFGCALTGAFIPASVVSIGKEAFREGVNLYVYNEDIILEDDYNLCYYSETCPEGVEIRAYGGDVATSCAAIMADGDVDIMFGWASNITSTGGMVQGTDFIENNGGLVVDESHTRYAARLTDTDICRLVYYWLFDTYFNVSIEHMEKTYEGEENSKLVIAYYSLSSTSGLDETYMNNFKKDLNAFLEENGYHGDISQYWHFVNGVATPWARLNILFIGNSFTYYNDQPSIFNSISSDVGEMVSVSSITNGSETLESWADPNNSQGALVEAALTSSSDYDIIILQEQSTTPINSYNRFLQAVETLQKRINETQDNCEIYLYETWGYEELASSLGCSIPKAEAQIREAYTKVGEETGINVSYVGKAFTYVYENNDLNINLYYSDSKHPSFAGSYLAACVHLGTILHRDPRENTFYGELEEDVASFLASVAYELVFN